MKGFMARHGRSDAFGPIGGSPGSRIKGVKGRKITEDDPRWNPKTMGNRKGREKGFTRDYGR